MNDDSSNNENKKIDVGDSDENQDGNVENVENSSQDTPKRELSDDFKWYIANTMTGQENKVKKALNEAIVNHHLTEFFADILVPEEAVVTNVNGKKRNIKKKFFPGYVLIKMIMNDKTWHLVKDTDKITGFIGGREKPTPLTSEEAKYMTEEIVEGGKKTRTSINFSEGDTVKVIEGPFASFTGTIDSVSDKGKVRVSVLIFGRPTPLELDFTQVEKIIL